MSEATNVSSGVIVGAALGTVGQAAEIDTWVAATTWWWRKAQVAWPDAGEPLTSGQGWPLPGAVVMQSHEIQSLSLENEYPGA